MNVKTRSPTPSHLFSSFVLLLLGIRLQHDLVVGFAPTVSNSGASLPRRTFSGGRQSDHRNGFLSPLSTISCQPRRQTTRGRTAGTTVAAAASPNGIPLSLVAIDLCAPDLLAITFGGSLLLFYHIRLFLKERSGKRTWRRVQADTREAWAQHVRSTEGWLYAIQTLRNAITAQTFLATTVLSLLTVIGGRLWDIVRQTSTCGRRYAIFQLILFAVPMISSAYYFLQSARLMTHAGFMFPVEPDTTKVDLIMRKTEHAQWLGLRCLYLAGAMLSLVVGGAKVFVGTSIWLTIFFRKVDRAPMAMDYGDE